MQKLTHRLFSQSARESKTRFIVPHIFQPSVKVVHKSTELIFPNNFDHSWRPAVDITFFTQNEITMRGNPNFCTQVNTLFKQIFHLANNAKQTEAAQIVDKLIAICEEHNMRLADDMVTLAKGWVNENSPMAYIAAMLGVKDQEMPSSLAITIAQIYKTLINKDDKAYISHEPKTMESLDSVFNTYLAAHDHYDEEVLAKIIFCIIEILHNNHLKNSSTSKSIERMISYLTSIYPNGTNFPWPVIALRFHQVFLLHQAGDTKSALTALERLESDLFSLNFIRSTRFTEKNKDLLCGAFVFNKCQISDFGYTEKNELSDYAHKLFSQALTDDDELITEVFLERKNSSLLI